MIFVINENLLFYKEETIPNNIFIHTMHIGQEFQKRIVAAATISGNTVDDLDCG